MHLSFLFVSLRFWFVSLSYSILVYLAVVYSNFPPVLTYMLYLVWTGYMYSCCIIQCCPTWQLVNVVITDCHLIAAVCQHELSVNYYYFSVVYLGFCEGGVPKEPFEVP